MKKLLSLILSLAIILSCVSMINFAPLEVQAGWTIRTSLPTSSEAAWDYYSAPINNYPISPYNSGNCTWYAYGRAYEVHGFDSGLGALGHAKYWYWAAYNNSSWQVDKNPLPGAVLCWDGEYGHVGFVEAVNSDGTVTWTESNYAFEGQNYPAFRKVTANPATYYSTLEFQGYIHVGTPKGSTVTPKPITYSTISDGTYYIKNNSNGEYISVSEAIDANGQNVNTWEFSENKFEQMILSKATSGYKMRPAICSSRLVNSYGDTVASGNNINIWDDVNDSSQWWGFEKVTGGYVIRNMMNSSCVMEVVNTGTTTREMQVRAYHGGTSQIWSIQNAVTYNANGGSGAPATQMKNYDSTLTLSSTKPTRTGYTFLGWATSSTATSATYSAGGSYTANKNVTLYAVWAKNATPAPTYTITYDANGGSGAPSSQTKTHGTALTLSSTKPTRAGYTFLGWATSSSATSATYSAGASFTSNASTTLYAVWGKNTYTISYDGNGATSGTTASQTTKTHTSTVLNSNGFKKEITVFFDGNGGTSTVSSETQEAKFVGWMDLEDFHYNGYKWNWYTFDAPFYANNNSDLLNYFGYNKLGLIKHWITNTIERSEHRESSQVFDLKYYMSNGGSDLISAFGDDAMSYAYHWMTQGYAEGRTGIDSVYTNDLNTYPNNAEVNNLSLINNDNVTLTAKWKPITVTLPSATRSGYTFKGWNTKSDGSGTQYNAGASVTTDVNTTLYAVWETKTYTITYDANGGSGAPSAQTKTHGTALTLSSTEPTRDGYTFLGWATSKTATSANYSAGASFTTNADTTLYAVWKVNTYTITYDANGGTGAPSGQIYTHGELITLSSTIPTRSNYIFRGWATDSSASKKEYSAGGSYTINESITLYAVWARGYEVAYNANGGTGAPESQEKFHKQNLTLSYVRPTRSGYDFLGWGEVASMVNPTYLPGATFTKDANTTLYAIWAAHTYTITYDANGGTGVPSAQTKTHDVALNLSSKVPTREGYNFLGWARNASTQKPEYLAGGAFVGNYNTTLYAVWETNTCTIKYNANGGANAPSAQTKTKGTDITLSSTMPTRTGYTFLGWAESSLATTATYLQGSKFSGDTDITLYAVWKANTYKITYNANGGTNVPASQTKTFGQTLILSADEPTRTGYTFLGWATSSSATSANYSAGGSFMNNANTTLYAVWKANTYTITYDANGGSGAPSAQTKTHGKILTLTSTKPTRDGYTFLGWATSSSAISANYSAGGSFMNNANTTLYAVWKANTYTITYDTNGGSGAPSAQTKTHGTALTLSSTEPTREGYTFLGWATNSTATSATYLVGGSFANDANTTLYAVWKAKTYTITYDANGGTGAPSAQTKTHGTALTLSSTEPTREGYTFLGWATSKTATSATYLKGASFTTNADTTLYAVWEEIITPDPIPENAATLTVETLTARAGETVQLAVKLENNPGIWGLKMVVNYDKTQLTLTNVVNGEIFADSEWTKGNLDKETYTLSYSANDFADITTNGTLAILEFTVNENATADATTEVKLTYEVGDIINIDFDDIELVVVSGGVEVKDFIYGDLNSDGLINKKDELLMKMYIAELDPAIDIKAADVFYDGAINKKDELRLKQYLADWDVTLGN